MVVACGCTPPWHDVPGDCVTGSGNGDDRRAPVRRAAVSKRYGGTAASWSSPRGGRMAGCCRGKYRWPLSSRDCVSLLGDCYLLIGVVPGGARGTSDAAAAARVADGVADFADDIEARVNRPLRNPSATGVVALLARAAAERRGSRRMHAHRLRPGRRSRAACGPRPCCRRSSGRPRRTRTGCHYFSRFAGRGCYIRIA
jgi:hypothetical protein